jgi:hypothetical protein
LVLDNFLVSQIDGVDIVWANHPNSLASAIMVLQAKLGIDNGQVQNTGGLAFDPVGHIANPAPAGVPSVWIDTTTAPSYALMYTDELGNNFDLRGLAFSFGKVYVDAIFGNDLTGDGTPGKPYKTLASACLAQPEPDLNPLIGMPTFMTPLIFYVAPGQYPEDVTYPQRVGITVVGMDCEIGGTHSWDIDPMWWDLFTLSDVIPYLVYQGKSYTPELLPHMVAGGQSSRQLSLTAGTLQVTNRNPTYAYAMPEWHTLVLDNVVTDAFAILNKPCATLLTDNPTGPMYTYLRSVRTAWNGGGRFLAGEVDRVEDGMGGGLFSANTVHVWAEDSDVALAGVCRIRKLERCRIYADRTLDHAGDPYVYGCVDGNFADKGDERVHVLDSMFDAFNLGCDPAALAPAHTEAYAMVLDRASLASFAEALLYSTMLGFSIGDRGAFGRGFMFEDDDLEDYSFIRIPHYDSRGDYPGGVLAATLFSYSYLYAGNWEPFGNNLSTTNRLRIEVEAGHYRFESGQLFDWDFIDVVGAKGDKRYPAPARSGTIFQFPYAFGSVWDCLDSSLENIWLERESSFAPPTDFNVVTFNGNATHCRFSNLWFSVVPGGVGVAPYAVSATEGVAGIVIGGTWRDCGADIDGLFAACSVNGTFIGCYAGDDSFAGGLPNTADGENVMEGYFEDCWAGDSSFGATRYNAGNASCGVFASRPVVLRRCIGMRGCFGATADGGDAACTADALDCIAYNSSFGVAFGDTGNALCEGVFVNCKLSATTISS